MYSKEITGRISVGEANALCITLECEGRSLFFGGADFTDGMEITDSFLSEKTNVTLDDLKQGLLLLYFGEEILTHETIRNKIDELQDELDEYGSIEIDSETINNKMILVDEISRLKKIIEKREKKCI